MDKLIKIILTLALLMSASLAQTKLVKGDVPSAFTPTTSQGLGVYAFDTGDTWDGQPVYNVYLNKNEPPVQMTYYSGCYFSSSIYSYLGSNGYQIPTAYYPNSPSNAVLYLEYDPSGRLGFDLSKAFSDQSYSSQWAYPVNSSPRDSFGNLIEAIQEIPTGSGNFEMHEIAPFNVAFVLPATPPPGVGTLTHSTKGTISFQAGMSTANIIDPASPNLTANPVNPDGTTPETGSVGPLSLDFASSLSFGKQSITSSDSTYYAHAQTNKDGNTPTIPNFVQVTDNRGTFVGWTLSVSQPVQFHLSEVTDDESDNSMPGDYLTGAEIQFTGGYTASTAIVGTPSLVNDNVTLNSGAQTLLTASPNEGMGTWVYALGAGISGTDNDVLKTNHAAYQENGGAALDNDAVSTKSPITLYVPGRTVKKAATYTTTLVWALSDTPANA